MYIHKNIRCKSSIYGNSTISCFLLYNKKLYSVKQVKVKGFAHKNIIQFNIPQYFAFIKKKSPIAIFKEEN